MIDEGGFSVHIGAEFTAGMDDFLGRVEIEILGYAVDFFAFDKQYFFGIFG